ADGLGGLAHAGGGGAVRGAALRGLAGRVRDDGLLHLDLREGRVQVGRGRRPAAGGGQGREREAERGLRVVHGRRSRGRSTFARRSGTSSSIVRSSGLASTLPRQARSAPAS